jgi:hypothetical protein
LNREEPLFGAVSGEASNDEGSAIGDEAGDWGELAENAGRSRPERVLREVLRRWDFAEPGGWRPFLERFLPRTEGGGGRGLRAEAEGMLERFAGSGLRQRLAAARTCRREVEYLFRPASAGEPLPVVRGVVDCLWQDAEGRWNLLFYSFEAVRSSDRERHWRRRQAGLVLAAAAVREQTGAWPGRVALCFLADGGLVERAGSRLGQRSVLPAVVRGLRAFSGPPTLG